MPIHIGGVLRAAFPAGVLCSVLSGLLLACKTKPPATTVVARTDKEAIWNMPLVAHNWLPHFEDTTIRLLNDTLETQCWWKGQPLIAAYMSSSKNLRRVDSCLCWDVRYRKRTWLIEGEAVHEPIDSTLLARLDKNDGAYTYSSVAGDQRTLLFDTSTVVLTDTLYVEDLRTGGMVMAATRFFKVRTAP